MKTVLFACIHNAGRSQMAAAWFNKLADPTKAHAISAGTAPAQAVHPEVIVAMAEVGLDLSTQTPQRLSDEVARTAQYLITMGCGDQCPVVPEAKRFDWPVADPKGQPPDVVRSIRDDIRARVGQLIEAEQLRKNDDPTC